MSHRRLALAAGATAGAILASAALATHLLLMQYTGAGNDHLGAAIAFGDVSGDGLPDVVVGADAGGYVRVYDGTDLSLQLHEFVGAAGDAFGISLAMADLNGDAHADVVVGAPSWDGPAGNDVGYVVAFDGVTEAELFELQGQKATDVFGSSLALDDVTGDGTPDLLVGAPFADLRGTNYNNGYVALFDGATRAQLHRWDGPEHYDEMGRGVAFGDVNDDGTPDIILGAGSGAGTNYGGYVRVMNGADFDQQLYSFTDGLSHVKPEQNFGFAVAAADVDGDSHADVIVGAYRGRSSNERRAPATGYARVFDGASGALLYQVNGAANGDQFGRAVAAGDVDGDGRPDVIVGARWGADGGYVRVFDGPTGALLDEQVAGAAFDWLGQSVAAGDLDGNGRANVAAGAYQGDSRSLSQGGYVRIYEDSPPASVP